MVAALVAIIQVGSAEDHYCKEVGKQYRLCNRDASVHSQAAIKTLAGVGTTE